MQDRFLFEYAVIRVVPRVDREEFLNVGVILYCAAQKFLSVCYGVNRDKLAAIAPQLDFEELEQNLHALEAIAFGNNSSSPIAQLEMAARFRWLTATRSTVVQSSKVHPGFCVDAATKLKDLCESLVL